MLNIVKYHLKLYLIIGVVLENMSRVLAQAFLSDEQTASFEYVLNHFVKICSGYPQVSHEGEQPIVSSVSRRVGSIFERASWGSVSFECLTKYSSV